MDKYHEMVDGCKIRYRFYKATQESKAILLMVTGFRDYIEKYDPFIMRYNQMGFDVLAYDHRGQGLSDRLLEDRGRSYIESFDLFVKDLNQIMAELITDLNREHKPVIPIGHSMGSHIVLRYLHDCNPILKQAILMSPLIDIRFPHKSFKFFAKKATEIAMRMGRQMEHTPGADKVGTSQKRLANQYKLTHDKQRYLKDEKDYEDNPDLFLGWPTYGWLNAAFKSLDDIKQDHYLCDIQTPMTVIIAAKDRVVDSDAARRYFKDRENIDLHVIKDGYHELYRETDLYRDQLFEIIDATLEHICA